MVDRLKSRLLQALFRQISEEDENDRVALYIPDPACDHMMRKMGAYVMTNNDTKVFSGVDAEGVANEFGIKDGDALIKLNENDADHMSTDEIRRLISEQNDLKMVVKRHEERYVEDTSGGVVRKMVETIEINDQAFRDACIFRGETAQMQRRCRKNPNKKHNTARQPNSSDNAHNHNVINKDDQSGDDIAAVGSERNRPETDSGFSSLSEEKTWVTKGNIEKQIQRMHRCSIYYEIVIPIGQISRPILRRLASRLWQGKMCQMEHLDTTPGYIKSIKHSASVQNGWYFNTANAYLATDGKNVTYKTSFQDKNEILVSEYMFLHGSSCGGKASIAVMIRFHYPEFLYLCCKVDKGSNDPVLYLDSCQERVKPESAKSSNNDDRLFFKEQDDDGLTLYRSTNVKNAYLCMGDKYLDTCVTHSPGEFKTQVLFNMVEK
ncbi:uncharacterized protein LOC117106586 [Anneissia japonica]|uniref:uncharacterized protein LOC117106586 n=1 Tax=Anneissia japonica TaxID=1529436 RepID=UPI001425B64A|nr:uncharacterized protein LOC117106586 [Anneissia japonica]